MCSWSYFINNTYLTLFLHLYLVLKVRVDLIDVPHVCSAASKRGKYRQEVKVGPQATKSVPFIIIPTKEGQYHIEVKAAVKDLTVNDAIMKMLQVVVRETDSMQWV